jgi:CHASE3 domain sensor protein
LTADNAEQQMRLARMEPFVKERLSLLQESVEFEQKTSDDRKQQDDLNNQSTKL